MLYVVYNLVRIWYGYTMEAIATFIDTAAWVAQSHGTAIMLLLLAVTWGWLTVAPAFRRGARP